MMLTRQGDETMPENIHDAGFDVVAKICGSCGCGCPTVLESGNSDELVIVGKLDALVLNSPDVQKHTGDGEIAVVIPKSLLMQAARALI
jgi:hypothetical protein